VAAARALRAKRHHLQHNPVLAVLARNILSAVLLSIMRVAAAAVPLLARVLAAQARVLQAAAVQAQ